MKPVLLLLAALAGPALALDINDASKEELLSAGFSAIDADRILAARSANGPFTSSRDLLRIEGISQGDLNRVRGKITIGAENVTTRSGTAPAIPGERPAIPGKKRESTAKSNDELADHDSTEHTSGDDSHHDSGSSDRSGKEDSGKGDRDKGNKGKGRG